MQDNEDIAIIVLKMTFYSRKEFLGHMWQKNRYSLMHHGTVDPAVCRANAFLRSTNQHMIEFFIVND